MPKAFGKEVPTPILLLAAGLGLYLVMTKLLPSGADVATTTTKKKAKKTITKNAMFDENDYKAKFAVYTEPPKNTFQPLIVSARGAAVKEVAGGLSTVLTGGEANWFYTGHVEVNGRPQALLENTSTGEAVYLAPGERFKNTATVSQINEKSVVFSGPKGPVTVPLNDPSELKRGQSVLPPIGGLAPMNPGAALSGPLPGVAGVQPGQFVQPGQPGQPGQAVAGQPGQFDGLAVQPDTRGGGGRGRRGGGGRNRGNFGGGGFGGGN